MSLFITFEGIEGSGKSTLQASVAQALQASGHNVCCTREPGGTTIGGSIRSILLDPSHGNLNALSELFLFSADRVQHIREIITPTLKKDTIVLCDRYIHSTIAYQSYAGKLPLTQVEQIITMSIGDVTPDLVILLDLDPSIGLTRARARSNEESTQSESSFTRFEMQELEFHHNVRNGFLDMAQKQTDKFLIIDASQDAATVSRNTLNALEKRLPSLESL